MYKIFNIFLGFLFFLLMCIGWFELERTSNLIRILALLIVGSILIYRFLDEKIVRIGLVIFVLPGIIALLYVVLHLIR